MKKILKRTLATFLVVFMLLTSAPLQGFVELEWPELSLPSVGQWFSGKASAADEKLTAEEAVDIFMNNKSIWLSSNPPLKPQESRYLFLDIDFDGTLELVTSWTTGTGPTTVNEFYKIDEQNKSIYSFTIPNKGAPDIGYSIRLYKSNTNEEKFYVSEQSTRNGWQKYIHIDKKIQYENDTISYISKFGYEIVTDDKTFEKSYHYYTYGKNGSSVNEVSSSEYITIRDRFYNQYSTDLNLKTKFIKGYDFVSTTTSTQRSLLLESYKAFCYDGMFEMNFTESEKEAYLGYPTDNIRDENDLHLIYKPANGDISKFDKSKVEFIVEDESIAEIKNITSLSLLKDSADIYADVCSKKIGETKVIAKYDGVEVAECKLIVKQPNELKFEIEDPNLKYFEADGVFFDDSNYLSKDGISLKMKYSNAFIDELNYEINDPEILKQLKYKNAKIVFEIEEGAGLSFENVDTVTKKEILLEDFDFLTEIEDSLNIFCTDSDALAMSNAVNAKIKCSVMLLENGEYVEKISEYIGFEVQSYKRHYINEHFKAMSPGGAYKSLLNNSYAAQMKGIEDTKDFKFVQFLNDGFVKAIADACGTIDEQQAYQLMIADLVSTISGNLSESTGEIYGETLLKRCGDILDVLVSMVEVEGLDGDLKKHILALDAKQISEFVAGTGKNEIMVDIFNRLTADDFYRDKLARTLGNAEKLGKICAYGGLLLSGTNDLIKIIRIYSSLDTISKMLEEQKCILKDLKAKAEEYGEIAIADALESYIDFSRSAITDDIIKTCVNNLADDSVDFVVMSTGKILTDMVVANINNFVTQEIFLVAGSTVSGFLAGFELGGFVSDLLCNNNDYGAACMQIVLGAHMSLIVKGAASSYLQEMLSSMNSDLDYSFKCAQKLDYSLNMFKQLEIMTCENTVAALSARATSAVFKTFCSNKFDDYRDAISYANCKKMEIDNVICHETSLANIYAEVIGFNEIQFAEGRLSSLDRDVLFKTLCVQCPVDVFVRNSKGEIVASVENNTVTKETGGVDIIVIEDEKFICLPSTEEYDIEVIATDEGTMDYTVFEYGSDSLSNIRSVSYEKIPLVKNKEFTAKLDTAKYTDKNNYNLSADSETITATKDDYVPVTSVSLDGDADTVYAGSEITLSVITAPENASPASFIWKSSDESVAAVSGGVVRGVKAGNAVITCELKSDSSIKASFEVTVTECSHSYSAWETVEESTCSEYGCKKRVCSVCNAVETEKITELQPHEAESESYELPASCEKNAATVTLCKNCGEICQRSEKQGTAIGHKLSAVAVDKKATTENSGSQSQKCSTCGERVNVTKIPRVIKPYLSQTSFVFDGKVKNPALMVYDYDGNKLAVNTDYRLTVDSGRVKPGTYKVVVGFIGKYEGTEKLSFTIAMKKTTVKATQNTTAIRLDWSAVPGAAGYRVFYKTAAGWKALCTTNKLTATFNKLPAGTKYTFAVMAGAIVDGKVIWADNYTVIETATQTLAPKKIAATQNANAIRLTWSKCPGATGYRIFYKSGNSWKICLNATTATSHTFTNLKAGTKFTFAVRPYIITDSGVIWSDYTTYTASTLPAIPKTAVTSPSSGKITVKWNAVSGAEAYQLYYKTGNGAYKLYKNYFSAQTVSFSGLKSGTKYTFAVRAAKNTSGGWVFGSFTPVSVTVK